MVKKIIRNARFSDKFDAREIYVKDEIVDYEKPGESYQVKDDEIDSDKQEFI